MWSALINEIYKDTGNDIDFQSRKRKNADAKKYIPSRAYNEHVIKRCYNYFNRIITSSELISTKIILSEDRHFSN